MSTAPHSPSLVRFGAFEFDVASGELRKNGWRIALADQPLEILKALIQRPGEIVTRDELRERVWPADTFVDFEHGLNAAVRRLREALGDSADTPRFVETVPRRGYRFIGPVPEPVLTGAMRAPTGAGPTPPDTAPMAWRRKAAPWLVAGTAIAAALTLTVVWSGRWRAGDVSPRTFQRLTIETPASLRLVDHTGPVISPDGRFVVVVDSERRLRLRRMDSLGFDVQPGTEGASSAFWSPDSRTIGFTAGRQVKVLTPGREVQTLCTLDGVGWSGAWSTRGLIVVSKGPNAHNNDGATLVTVSPSSGASAPLTTLDASRGDLAHGLPEFLPDGGRIAFAVVSKDPAKSGVYVAAVDGTGVQRPFPVRTRGSVRFAADYALVSRGSSIFGYRFDTGRLEASGEPTLIVSDLQTDGESSEEFDGTFSVSRDGVVVYRASRYDEMQLAWVRRDGTPLAQIGGRLIANDFVLSSDDTRAALTVSGPDQEWGIAILDLIRGTTVPFASKVFSPIWSPDGSEIVFTAPVSPERTGARSPTRLFRKPTRHDGPAVAVLPPEAHEGAQIWPKHWTADGRTLVYLTQSEGRNQAFSLRLDGASAPVPLDLPAEVFDALRVSPDGRLLAYIVFERGRSDVFLQPFAGPGERVRVTTDGGGQPQWRADGKELYYVTPGGSVMAVSIDPGGRLDPNPARRLFAVPAPTAMWARDYAPGRDGQRFLVKLPGETGLSPLRVVSNWQYAGGGKSRP